MKYKRECEEFSPLRIPSRCCLLAQTRNNFVSTKQEVEKLMKRIRSADQDYKPPGQWTMEGFLYMQEKRELAAHLALSHPSRPSLCKASAAAQPVYAAHFDVLSSK